MTPRSPLIQENRLLAPLTSWRIGGAADFFAEPAAPSELAECLREAERLGATVFALGGGSNVLVADEGFRGMVIRYSDRTEVLEPGGERGRVRAGAGVSLARLARRLAREGWAGLEWAEGIPGTIGGAVVGNAGAYGSEIGNVVAEVESDALDTGRVTRRVEECEFRYRHSRFRRSGATAEFVLAATFELRRDDPVLLGERVREIAASRKARTPVGLSCGSVFKNPPGRSAGQLIEQAGLKGSESGGAQISPLHGNYIVNRGGATARDVLALIHRARARVREECGIVLELEVHCVGCAPEPLPGF
jgi:UDP-N-acetylmuramate dehydrogenase